MRVTNVTKQRSVPKTWQEALKLYLIFKKAQGRRPTTLHGQRNAISIFCKRHPDAYLSPDPSGAIFHYMGENVKPATYNIRRVYLKQFFDWCIQEGLYSDNPLTKLKNRKDPGSVVNIELDILRGLLELPNRETYAGLRDYAMLVLTMDTGLRPSEALALQKTDFDLAALELRVRPEVAKTGVARTLPISDVTATVIRQVIESRHPRWDEKLPVICTCDGTRMDRYSWGDRLEIYCKKLGVRIGPYDLRHAFALQYLRNGGNALALQRTMGHTDLTMTKRYVALTQGDIREQHQLASPLNSLIPRRGRVRKVYPTR